jgi:serine-type D-Ala-D-Ala carboxypeptidase/endopeptidase (penicillin-binding protein 4)
MQGIRWLKNRAYRNLLPLIVLVSIVFAFAGAAANGPLVQPDGQALSPAIQKIMNGPLYKYGEWGLLEVDPATGRTINFVAPPTRFFEPGSTAKIVTASAALDDLGFGYHFTTPVFGIGKLDGAAFNGDLVLVAQGDLTMGGRTKPDGTVDYTPVDHTYANDIPGSTLTPEDPLAGLNQIAQQVRTAGITKVNGDVIIDDRLFKPEPDFPVVPVPMLINDNLIDIVLTPGKVGDAPASVSWRPQVAPYHLDMQAKTVAAGQPTTLATQLFPDGRILVSGNIAVDGGRQVRTSKVLDPASFARTALIEALGRAGVTVSAGPTGGNPAGKLPANSAYQGATRLAAYVSPAFQEYTKLILKVSHNLGANLLVCLMAVKAGSSNCLDGFPVMASFLDRAKVDRTQIALADGQGGASVDRVTPRAEIDLLRYWLGRPEAKTFREMLPILGVDGSLAGVCTKCPGKGKVFAKTGTVFLPDPLNGRGTLAWADAGYLEAQPGKYIPYYLVVNGAVVSDFEGVLKVNDELGLISSMLQQEAARR